jgi:hypothetical protein
MPSGYLAWLPSLNPIQDRLQLLLVDSSGRAQRHQLLVDLISVLSENSTARGLCYWMIAACVSQRLCLYWSHLSFNFLAVLFLAA